MAFSLPKLNYSDLAPFISKTTLDYHHGKHHATYVNKLNSLISGSDYEQLSLEAIVSVSRAEGDTAVFRNAAQTLNHNFYWKCLTPNDNGQPSDELKRSIQNSFGSFEVFRKKFIDACVGNFASGWTWLVADKSNRLLSIVQTDDAETVLTDSKVQALLVVDVWEHAYYIDYKNDRPKYVADLFDNLLDWRFINNNFAEK